MLITDAPSEPKPHTDRRIHNRRIAPERRKNPDGTPFGGEERRKSSRRKVERRRMIDPTTCERDYSGDEVEFMKAMDDYKRKSGRMFPTWSEVLEVVRSLGYTRPEVTDPQLTASAN
jgi:hypothetical protein